MKEKKLQFSIYKIDLDNELFTSKSATESSEDDFDTLKSYIKDFNFVPQQLLFSSKGGFDLALFHLKKSSKPKWKEFFNGIAQTNQSILDQKFCSIESFVFLLKSEKTGDIYAVTGGMNGYHSIQEIVEDDFGIEILSRLIKKGDKILRAIRDKSVTGGVLGSTKFFRKDHNLYENDNFGKIYQEVQANIDKDFLTEYFGFSAEDLKKGSLCVATSSFKIRKSVEMDQILKIISGCEIILEKIDPISINSVKLIKRRKNKSLISVLEKELIKQLWNRYQQQSTIDFDLCHKDFENYLTASKYIVKKNNSSTNFLNYEFEELKDIDCLFQKIKDQKLEIENFEDFEKLILSLKIHSYHQEDELNFRTSGRIIDHIFGHIFIQENSENYFLINNIWYKIEDDFINSLNESCSSFINNNKYKSLNRWKWNSGLKEDEGSYNLSHAKDNNTLILDKITPDNIELCDILRWDDDNIYLIHVKKGFNNSMRDLCAQILIAAQSIQRNSVSSKRFIKNIYQSLIRKNSSAKFFEAEKELTEEEFLNLFNKKIVFVLAVFDSNNQEERRMEDDISKYKSAIAKFSLQELVKDIKKTDFDLNFSQIEKG